MVHPFRMPYENMSVNRQLWFLTQPFRSFHMLFYDYLTLKLLLKEITFFVQQFAMKSKPKMQLSVCEQNTGAFLLRQAKF